MKKVKIVINVCFGGFGLSNEADLLYAEKSGFKLFHYIKDGVDGYYRRAKLDELSSISCSSFKSDHGDNFNGFPEDGSYWYSGDIDRDDPVLVEVVEELGTKANGFCAELKVVEIPDGVDWEIDEYDGNESIEEVHSSWR